MELGHLLTSSGLTYPKVSTKVYRDSFCQLGSSFSLTWVICFEAFYLHVVSSFSCIPVIWTKLVFFNSFLTPTCSNPTLLWAHNPFRGNFNYWQVSRKEAGQIFFENDVSMKYRFVYWGVQNSYPDDLRLLPLLWKFAAKHIAYGNIDPKCTWLTFYNRETLSRTWCIICYTKPSGVCRRLSLLDATYVSYELAKKLTLYFPPHIIRKKETTLTTVLSGSFTSVTISMLLMTTHLAKVSFKNSGADFGMKHLRIPLSDRFTWRGSLIHNCVSNHWQSKNKRLGFQNTW